MNALYECPRCGYFMIREERIPYLNRATRHPFTCPNCQLLVEYTFPEQEVPTE